MRIFLPALHPILSSVCGHGETKKNWFEVLNSWGHVFDHILDSGNIFNEREIRKMVISLTFYGWLSVSTSLYRYYIRGICRTISSLEYSSTSIEKIVLTPKPDLLYCLYVKMFSASVSQGTISRNSSRNLGDFLCLTFRNAKWKIKTKSSMMS